MIKLVKKKSKKVKQLVKLKEKILEQNLISFYIKI